MERWHVAVTDSRAERDTCEGIVGIGFDAFTPVEKHKRFVRGKKTIIEAPLFPRYLFTKFDSTDPQWNALREVDGVFDILCNQGEPSPVPNGLVEKLQRMQKAGIFDHTQRPNPYPPGTEVLTDDDGPFADLIGKVMRVRTGDRVDLLLKYLGREITINVSLARLSRVS